MIEMSSLLHALGDLLSEGRIISSAALEAGEQGDNSAYAGIRTRVDTFSACNLNTTLTGWPLSALFCTMVTDSDSSKQRISGCLY
jgi:hypothetical protein